MNPFYNVNKRTKKILKEFRKDSLKNRTLAELWAHKTLVNHLGSKEVVVEQIFGMRRFDFYIPRLSIAIEIDGGYHENPEQKQKDIDSDKKMQSKGIIVYRVKNFDNEKLMDYILIIKKQIEAKIKEKEQKKKHKIHSNPNNTSKGKIKKIKAKIRESVQPKNQRPKLLQIRSADCRVHDSLKFKSNADRERFMQEQLERALKK